MKIIVLFNLKSGVDSAAYEAWAKARDLPGVRSLPSIDDFNIYRATGLLGSTDKPPFDYIEIIDIADMNGFWKDIATDASTQIAKEFRDWLDAPPIFMLTEALSLASSIA